MNPRRSMIPSSDLGSGRSGLNSTTKKPAQSGTSSMRMSLAGPSSFRQSQSAMPPPGTGPRQSVFRPPNPLLASTTKQGYGRTPVHNNTMRRGSTWGTSSSQPPSQSLPVKDTRPLRDKQHQAFMRRDIIEWCKAMDFDLTAKDLADVTGKSFRMIFTELVQLVDPKFPFFEDKERKWELQFMDALRAVGYPWLGSLDAKWLAAPASMHSWPSLLGVLHWLVEMGKGLYEYKVSGHVTLQDEGQVPEAWPDDQPHMHQAVLINHYARAYEVFLEGHDTYPDQDAWLMQRYAKKDQEVTTDLEKRREELQKLKSEYSKLKSSAPPIHEQREMNTSIKGDRDKFEAVLVRLAAKERKVIAELEKEKLDLKMLTSQRAELEANRSHLDDLVRQQNLSEEEVVRMNTDHESLSRNVKDLRHRITETKKDTMSLEVSHSKHLEAAEVAVDTYTNLLHSLRLFPPLPPPLEHVDLTLEMNTASESPAGLLLGADIRAVIKPTLSRIADMRRKEKAQIESARDKVEAELDALTQDCETLDDDIREVEMKTASLRQQGEDVRAAASDEAAVASERAAALESKLAEAKLAAKASGMDANSRLQAVRIAYREQIEKVAKLKDETIRGIVKSSTEIGDFKASIQEQLGQVKKFAEEN